MLWTSSFLSVLLWALCRCCGIRDGEEMALAGKRSRDEGSGSLAPSRAHLCSISPGERDDCGSQGDPGRQGAWRCSEPRKHHHAPQQSLRHSGAQVPRAAHVFVPCQLPSEHRLGQIWAAALLQGGGECSELTSGASGSRAGSGKEGWEKIAGLSEAVAGLHLGSCLRKDERGAMRAKWESQHFITMMLHQRYVQLWAPRGEERGLLRYQQALSVSPWGKAFTCCWPPECSWTTVLFGCQNTGARLCYFLSPYTTASELEWISLSISAGNK